MNPPVSAQSAQSRKRVIGPIPPRGSDGRLQLLPVMGKRPKLNILGEPARDHKGQPIEEEADLRDPWEYLAYEPGREKDMDPKAIEGKRLYRVDHDVEPIALVFARDEDDAVRVYKREFGVLRFGDKDPVVTPAE